MKVLAWLLETGLARRPRSSLWVTFGTTLLPLLAWGVLLLIFGEPMDYPFTFMVIPVIAAAWWGGLGPGLVATLLAAAGAWDLATPPPALDWSHGGKPVDVAALALFVANGLVITFAFTMVRRREQRFDQLANTAREVFWLADASLANILYCSPAFEDVWGRSLAELYAHPHLWAEAIHPDDRNRVWEDFSHIATAGAGVQCEYRIVRPDGSIRWIADHGMPVRDESGKIYRLAGVAQDITDRKAAEAAVHESEEKYRSMAESASSAIVSADHTGRIVAWNVSAEKMFGYTAAEAIGQPLPFIIPERHRAGHIAGMERLRRGEASRVIGHTVELEGLRKDGREFPLELSLSTWQQGGEPFFTGIIQDITARKAAEEELRDVYKENTDLRAAMDAAAIVMITDARGAITYANDRFCELSKYSREELLGRNHRMVKSGYHPAEFYRAMWHALTAGRIWNCEFKNRAKDGSHYWVDSTIIPVLSSDGKPARYWGIQTDITERKESEARLQLAQSQLAHMSRITIAGELAASIAHDVNQPIGAVVGNAGAATRWLARQPPNLEEARNALHNIIQDANRAAEVIRGVRSFLQKDRTPFVKVDINEVIRSVLLLLERQLRSADVAVQTHLDSRLPAVSGHRVQLQQVLLNLIMNSLEAMLATRDRRRSLSITSSRADSQSVMVQVSDTGEGLKEGQVERVSEPFFTTKPDGLGMGLWISRSIVESHGGRLWLESTSPQGAEFRLTLPPDITAHD